MTVFLIAFLVLLAAGVFSLVYAGPKMIIFPRRRTPEYYQERSGLSHPSQLGLHFRECRLRTSDGLLLSYWIIEDPNCKKYDGTIIYLHGITDSKASGLGYAKELAGFCQRFFLIDMRRHGESEGKYCTFGYYEKHDVVSLIDEIKHDSPHTQITLLGASMGAAIAIQAAAIDKRVNRVIAIAPFYDLYSIALDHQVRKIGIRSKFLLRLVLKRAEHLARFKVSDVSPAIDIKKINVPLLIVHGENDKSVKREYPSKLAELNKNARLLSIRDAAHVDVLEKGGRDYLKQLVEFMKA